MLDRLGESDSSSKVLELAKLATERMSFGFDVSRNRRRRSVSVLRRVSGRDVGRLGRGGGNGHACHISRNVSLRAVSRARSCVSGVDKSRMGSQLVAQNGTGV